MRASSFTVIGSVIEFLAIFLIYMLMTPTVHLKLSKCSECEQAV
jgi:hypothetical protein